MNAEPWVWGLIGFVAGCGAVVALAWTKFRTSLTEQGPLIERAKETPITRKRKAKAPEQETRT